MLICELPKSITYLSVNPEQEPATVWLLHIINICMNSRAVYTFQNFRSVGAMVIGFFKSIDCQFFLDHSTLY